MIVGRQQRSIIAIVMALFGGTSGCTSDPGYKGRSSAEWIAQLDHGTPDQRVDAAFALSHVLQLQPNAPRAARALTAAVRDTNDAVRIAAAVGLRRAGERAQLALPAIAEMLRDSAHANVRRTAATLLGDLGGYAPHQAVPPLQQAITDDDAGVRYAVAAALGRLGSRAGIATRQLVAAIGDRDADVRAQAIDALSRVGAPHDTVAAVLQRALADTVTSVRIAAVQAIARSVSDPSQLAEALRAPATDPRPLVRLSVVYALSVASDKAARDMLRRAAMDSSPVVKREALHMLSNAHQGELAHPTREPSTIERCQSGAARSTDQC